MSARSRMHSNVGPAGRPARYARKRADGAAARDAPSYRTTQEVDAHGDLCSRILPATNPSVPRVNPYPRHVRWSSTSMGAESVRPHAAARANTRSRSISKLHDARRTRGDV